MPSGNSNRRYARGLGAVKRTETPSLFCFVDTETTGHPAVAYRDNRHVFIDGEFHTLRLGVATSIRLEDGVPTRRDWCNFTDADSFWNWLYTRFDKSRPLWLFSHNLGFDLTILRLWERIASDEYLFRDSEWQITIDKSGRKRTKGFQGLLIHEDPPTVVILKHRDGFKLHCVDTVNWFLTSLRKMGETVGFHKLQMPAYDAPDSEWFTYCKGDVEVLERIVLGVVNWVQSQELGGFKFTAASQAMSAFRHRFHDGSITLHDNPQVKQLERDSYYGGRLECFYIGHVGERCIEYDVKSMYPFVMANNPYPIRLQTWGDGKSRHRLRVEECDTRTIAEVTLNVPTDGYPYRCGLGTIYPVGRYTTILAGPELVRAVGCGTVESVGRWAKYSMADVFSSYIEYFWQERKQALLSGDKLASDLCKLMMNSLYGKFGQMTPEWVDIAGYEWLQPYEQWVEYHAETESMRECRKIGQLVQAKQTRGEHPGAFPAIAAYVTAYAREYMRELWRIAGLGNCYYLVTDALYVNAEGEKRLIESGYVEANTLGKLERGAEAEYADFEALHHYQLGEKRKYGSRKSKGQLWCDRCHGWTIHKAGFCPVCGDRLTASKVRELHFQGLSSILKGEPLPGVYVYPQVKSMSRSYDRGHIGADGWVSPLNLSVAVDREIANKGSIGGGFPI